MKPAVASTLDIFKTPSFVKFMSLTLLSLSFLLIIYHLPSYFPSAVFTTSNATSASQTLPSSPKTKSPVRPPPSFYVVTERTGIVDETGAMTEDFEIGDIDLVALEEMWNILVSNEGKEEKNSAGVSSKVKYGKYRVCEESKSEYIPCLDNVEEIKRLNVSHSLERFERHCPEQGKGLDCLVPMPKGYQKSLPWPQSRDEVWLSNVPHTSLADDKGGQNLIAIKKDKFIFPRGGAWLGEDQYLNQISQMIPDIIFGHHIQTALDIGCGVASFGASLLQRNVTTLSISPKDVHENQIQFALERGVPAMVAVFATRRLLFPSQAFDLLHCLSCGIDWTSNDGIWLLEADRMLRAGGYFVWATEPAYKHKENIQEQGKEMQDLTSRICWRLVKKEGYIAIWQKPLNNSCYLKRGSEVQPSLCDPNDDPDNVWYVNLRTCITRLPENGHGANVSTWPTRLHYPPDRLYSIKMDFSISRKELFLAESSYWNDVIDGYVLAYHWKQMNWRNVMDMKAGFGGFAAAMHAHQIDSWVMNVVPTDEFNTLPVIYDRGLIGVMHDWCEPFDTYPRTYDLLHAAGLFSAEKKRNRCNISSIMLEMDRILRHGGTVYIRDTVSVMGEVEEITAAMGWVTALHDTAEGPLASWKVLLCDKRMP